MNYDQMRRAYLRDELTEEQLPEEPLTLFHTWMQRAIDVGEPEPNAMALATVGADGQPRVRFVLLKDATEAGFVFFTNYESAKGRDLAAVPRASLAFWWPNSERQVRVDGAVTKLAEGASDEYFASRPRGSQLSTWGVRQGEPVTDRQELERTVAEAAERFEGQAVPRPPYWGGYVLAPTRLEFWQGRGDRLHDRFEYVWEGAGWRSRRLAP